LATALQRKLPALEMPRFGKAGAPIKKSQLWQRELVGELRARARERVRALPGASDRVLPTVLDYVERRRRESDAGAQLDALCHIFAALDELPVSPGVAVKLIAWGRSILAEQRIDPRRSRLANLHGELERSAAAIALDRREPWDAAWSDNLARLSADDRDAELVEIGELALLAGDASAVIERLLGDVGGRGGAELRAARARWLRLSGRAREAGELVAGAKDAAGRWERACCQATTGRSLQSMVHALRDRRVSTPARQLELWLWAHATRSKVHRRQALQLSTIQRSLGRAPAVQCARAIESLTRRSARPLARLRDVGQALRAAADVGSTQRELLIWAAAARCLRQAKQPRFADLALARYRSLSVLVSAGRTGDVLAVAVDLGDGGATEVSWDDLALSARDARVPRRARDRYIAFGRLATDAVLGQVAASLRGGDASLELCQLLTDHLGYLKGPLMKIGQTLSHYGLGLGEEERALLAALNDGAPAVDFETICEVITRELGSPAAAFADLSPEPLATGSFGQVHAARLHDGRDVVVKVQYPGVESALATDLTMLRLATPILARVRPNWNMPALIDELASLVETEIDYRLEAESQELFATLFADDDEIVIPAVFRSHSTGRVLTSERIDGLRIDELARRGTRTERDAAGLRIARFVTRCTFVERILHTDPHPGNFLVLPDGIAVVDFGSVKRWRGDEGVGWFETLEAIMADSPEDLGAAFDQLGMLRGPVDLDVALASLRRWTMRWTTAEGPASFGVDDVASEIRTWLREPALRNLVIQPADLYGFRIYWGMFALLARLGARVDLRPLVAEIGERRRAGGRQPGNGSG
jgi:predicted unusual protein kinase regulating ubiquinone biosynthesis (AarF/ABC1/UbiB family)